MRPDRVEVLVGLAAEQQRPARLVIVDGRISSVLKGAELAEGNIRRRFMPIAAVPAEVGAANGGQPHQADHLTGRAWAAGAATRSRPSC